MPSSPFSTIFNKICSLPVKDLIDPFHDCLTGIIHLLFIVSKIQTSPEDRLEVYYYVFMALEGDFLWLSCKEEGTEYNLTVITFQKFY